MKRILAFILAMLMTVGVLTSCGETESNDLPNDDKEQNEENKEKEENEGKDENGKNWQNENSGGVQQSTNNNQTNTQTEKQPDYTRFAHSDTYNRYKVKLKNILNSTTVGSYKKIFLTKAVPFNFLAEQGIVYYTSDGEPRVYGIDEKFDYEHNECIQSKPFIDMSTPENDFYLLIQYISAPIDDSNSNGDTYVATYMLKYLLADDCYRDLLLLWGDYDRRNLLIQEIDQEYTPELISKSLIRYDLIKSLKLFKDLPYDGNTDASMYGTWGGVNYVSNIDYVNMEITVNYNLDSTYKWDYNPGAIYSYTYKLKETPNWDNLLQGGKYTDPIPQEKRDALTVGQIMPTYSSNVGSVLNDTRAFNWTLSPSASQKATATIKYEFSEYGGDISDDDINIDKYEAGTIDYSQVNFFTNRYVSSLYANK